MKISTIFPKQIKATEERIEGLNKDIATINHVGDETFSMKIKDQIIDNTSKAGKKIIDLCTTISTGDKRMEIGEYKGMGLPDRLHQAKDQLENTQNQLDNAINQIKKPFQFELELKQKLIRLDELNYELLMDEKEDASEIGQDDDREQIKQQEVVNAYNR